MLLWVAVIFGQQDTLQLQIETDSLAVTPVSPSAITTTVTYNAQGYIYRDIVNKKVVLVTEAKVDYGNIEITADSILIDMNANTLYAVGRKDTSGTVKGSPVFKEGEQEIAADSLLYNFKSKRAIASNIVTKQDQGLLRSKVTKLLEDGTSNIAKSTYSTCDAPVPHFYINLPRAKVYPGEKIVSGPGNLVLEGIPLPLFLPFAYFPIQTKSAASGILIPRIGQEAQRGYSLTDGGYYFAINNYFDLTVRGNIYTNGTWMGTATTNYRKLYKYSGNFSFSYANNVSGHKGLPDFSESSNYKIGWTYNQDPKAAPGSRFSASVNMSSAGFDRNNSYVVSEHVTTQRQSSISYSKSWAGTPFNFSTSMNHTQDIRQHTVSLNLPKANFNMNRIYPLKKRNSAGAAKWYEDVQFSYSASLDNRIKTTDSLLFTPAIWKNMDNGFQHRAPLSLQIRPFRNFSITPSITYEGVLFSKKYDYRFVNRFTNPETGQVMSAIIRDTISGLSYGHALTTNINMSFNPQIYGLFEFTNPASRVQSIRHVIKPSVSFSYDPALRGLSSKMYRQVQYDTLGNYRNLSIYENMIYGTPSVAERSGSISLSLVNLVEAKVFERNDTTGKPKKVKIIDNLGITTSYNVFADSMRWAPISMQARTTIANSINISATSSFSLYGYDHNGRTVSDFAIKRNGKLMRMTNFNTSLDMSVSDLLKGNKAGNRTSVTPNALTGGAQTNAPTDGSDLSQRNNGTGITDPYGYTVFNVPWTMNLSYNISYMNTGISSRIDQTMTLSGNVSVTKKMSMNYATGYDFKGKEITMTQIGISRDLHCWEMSFNWVPNGTMKMWNFTIRVKASVLGDLKYERRKDFHDIY